MWRNVWYVWFELSHCLCVDIDKLDILILSRHNWRRCVPHLEHQRARLESQKSGTSTRTHCFLWQRRLQKGEDEDGRKVADEFVTTPDLEAHQSVPTKDALMFLFLPREPKIFRTPATSKPGTKSKVDQTYDLWKNRFRKLGLRSDLHFATNWRRALSQLATSNLQRSYYLGWWIHLLEVEVGVQKVSKTEMTNIDGKHEPESRS